MIVKFTTRFGHLTMLGESAVTLLRMTGHSGGVPGAILAADLPHALDELRKALEVSGDLPSPAPVARDETDDEDDDRERESPVSLRTRAVPLIDMIETAIARSSDLMWEGG